MTEPDARLTSMEQRIADAKEEYMTGRALEEMDDAHHRRGWEIHLEYRGDDRYHVSAKRGLDAVECDGDDLVATILDAMTQVQAIEEASVSPFFREVGEILSRAFGRPVEPLRRSGPFVLLPSRPKKRR